MILHSMVKLMKISKHFSFSKSKSSVKQTQIINICSVGSSRPIGLVLKVRRKILYTGAGGKIVLFFGIRCCYTISRIIIETNHIIFTKVMPELSDGAHGAAGASPHQGWYDNILKLGSSPG